MITIIIPEWVVWVIIGLISINVLLMTTTLVLRIIQLRIERSYHILKLKRE